MARRNYKPGDMIWRFGKPYHATRYNRSLPKSAFPGSRKQTRLKREQQQLIGHLIGMIMMLFIWAGMFIFFSLASIIVLLSSIIGFFISFILKIPLRIILSKIGNKKIEGGIFSDTKFEKWCINGMKKSEEIFGNGMRSIGREMRRIDMINKRR